MLLCRIRSGVGSCFPCPPLPALQPLVSQSHAERALSPCRSIYAANKTVLLKDGTEVADEVVTMDEYMQTGHDGLTTQGQYVQRL